jgi:hypothetical protein
MKALLLANVISGLMLLRGSFSAPWDSFNLSPSHRAISVPSGTVPVALTPQSPSILIDFGKEVGGEILVCTGTVSGGSTRLSFAFSESTYYVTSSDNSNGGSGNDGAFLLDSVITPNTNYSLPHSRLRGGFRYLRIFLTQDDAADCLVQLLQITLLFTPAPLMSDPSKYANHFFCNDDLINRVWWAGAYTVQLSTIDPKHARVWPPPTSGWDNSAFAGLGSSILVDGAKRDRMVWGGDCGVSIPTAYVSTGDTASAANAVATLLLQCQNEGGVISMVGPPICNFFSSDTYHLWALIGVCNVYSYTQDLPWLSSLWARFVAGISASAAKIGSGGLMNVTLNSDWARTDMGGENIAGIYFQPMFCSCCFRASFSHPFAANALLFKALSCGSQLSQAMGQQQMAANWTQLAQKVQGFSHIAPHAVSQGHMTFDFSGADSG